MAVSTGQDGKKSGDAGAVTAALSPDELAQRAAVLRRFRELLQAQRDRFRTYLEALDHQKDVIETGSPDELTAHVELEEKIVADIFAIQKVIDPLEDMYRAACLIGDGRSPAGVPDDAAEIPSLKSALEGLKAGAVVLVERNKALLSKRMTEIRTEIKTLRKNPYTRGRSIYAGAEAPSLIDIEG
jgi:hypothetical protein